MSTRYVRPAAVAGSMVTGWNIAPNIDYALMLVPSPSACAIQLMTPAQQLIATGAAPTGVDQPCTLFPADGQTLGMVDQGLGWHLRLSTTGAERPQTIAIAPHSDLSDINHPAYTSDDLSLARARAEIDRGTHATEELTVFAADFSGTLGDIVEVGVDGNTLTGQLVNISRSGSPDGTTVSATIRTASAITPSVAPPGDSAIAAVDDTGETDAATVVNGNVLDNDSGNGLISVAAVNGVAGNVGQVVDGSTGGQFVIHANGSWEFDPARDFRALTGAETAATTVSYTVTDGTSSDSATLTVTVSSAASLWTPAAITTTLWLDAADSETITQTSGKISHWADKSGNERHVSQSSDAARPVITAAGQNGMDVVTFDGGDLLATAANFPETGNAEFSVFWVYKKTAAGGSAFGWGNSNTSLGCFGLYDNGSVAGFSYGGGKMYRCNPPALNQMSVWAHIKTPGVISITTVLTKDGANAGTSSHSTSTPNIVNGLFTVGQWSSSSMRLFGSVAEFIVCPAALSTTDRRVVEGYLAHKWGLADSLPSDHPYKSAPPTI